MPPSGFREASLMKLYGLEHLSAKRQLQRLLIEHGRL